MELDLEINQLQTTKYWELDACFCEQKSQESETEIIKQSELLLKQAIQRRIGDTKEVGTFLSGGYDSSTLLALISSMQKDTPFSFTMGFDDDTQSEAHYAENIAQHLHSIHCTQILQKKDLIDGLYKIGEIYPEPFGDKAALASMRLTDEARKKTHILFGGEGGDELFYASSFLKKFHFIHTLPRAVKWIVSKTLGIFPSVKYEKWSRILSQKHIEDILVHKDILLSDQETRHLIKNISTIPTPALPQKATRPRDYLDAIFPTITAHYVSNNLLTKMNALALYHDIDIKLPYLDVELITYMAHVEASLKTKEKKYILKNITHRYIPKDLLDRPKKGFSVPLDRVIKANFDEIMHAFLDKESIKSQNLFNIDAIEKIKEQFLSEKSYYSEQKMWNLLVFQAWFQHWYKDKTT